MRGGFDDFIVHLKEDVQKKFGHQIAYSKDCQILSDELLDKTNRQVSASTLKRFFGIIKSPFNPSKFTLDTLSVYLDFTSWQDFINSFEENKHEFSDQNTWENLKIRTNIITDYSLKSLKSKIGKHLKEFPLRKFAIKKIDSFLDSSKTATAFIAPAGYDKSTLATQLAQRYKSNKSGDTSDDITCLVDGGILFNLISHNYEIDRLTNLLEYNPDKSFTNIFRANPDQVKGKFILIIDGLNDLFYQKEKLHAFIDNLTKIILSHSNLGWFKLVVTCRPDDWQSFISVFRNNPIIKNHWFDVPFDGNLIDTNNVPLLKKKEIKKVLMKNNFPKSFENLTFHYPEITELISYPYFLRLFLLAKDSETIQSDIELLDNVAYQKVLSEPYSDEKSRIINSYIQQCENGRTNISVQKDKLISQTTNIAAYNELISHGILYEYTIADSYLSLNTYVKFSHIILFEYFLANKWLKENELNIDLLDQIIEYYKSTPNRRCNILKYVIKFAFKEENIELLQNIYSIFQSDVNSNNSIDAYSSDLINTIGVELRNNKKLRDILVPFYAKSKLGQHFYFESFFDMDCLVLHSGNNLELYMEFNDSNRAIYYGYFMKFMQYFLASDRKKSEEMYNMIRNLGFPEHIKPINANFFFCAQIIYQSACLNEPVTQLMEHVYQLADKFRTKNVQPYKVFPHFEFAILFALNFGNEFDEIIHLTQHINDKYDISKFESTVYYHITQAIYARALLNTGKHEEANKIFNQVNISNIPIYFKHYLNIRYQFIQLEFLIFNDKIKKASKVLKEIKTISHMLKFYYFYEKAEKLEKTLFMNF